jgi:hypothetical protein
MYVLFANFATRYTVFIFVFIIIITFAKSKDQKLERMGRVALFSPPSILQAL